jgi:hypothetical protein
VRGLVPAAVRSLSAISLEQRIEPSDHLALRGIRQELQRDRGECAVEIVGAGECLSDIQMMPKRRSSGMMSSGPIA